MALSVISEPTLLLILTFSKILGCVRRRDLLISKFLDGAEWGTFRLMFLMIRETRKLLLLMFRRKESQNELRNLGLPINFLDFTAIPKK